MQKTEILDETLIAKFAEMFANYLRNYKLSYYLRDKDSDFSKENIIHSSIIWIRFCVQEINKSKIFKGSTEAIELYTLISIVDTLKEGLDQISRVLFDRVSNDYGNDK